MRSISEFIREIVSTFPSSDGEVIKKFWKSPEIKPPRRGSPVHNKSNRDDYMKNYMKEYREDGKDYIKLPERTKEKNRERKKKEN